MTAAEICEIAMGGSDGPAKMGLERLRTLSAREVEDFLRWSDGAMIAAGARNAMTGCVVSACVGIGAIMAATPIVVGNTIPAPLPLLITGSMLVAFGVAASRRMKERQPEEEAIVLELVAAPRVCDPLLRWLFAANPRVTPHLEKALVRLLPRLAEEDYGAIYPEARVSLNRILNVEWGRFPPEFIIAALTALARIGDESAVRPLETVTRQELTTDTGKQIRAAASESLRLIRIRIEKARDSGILLRPSAESTIPLLRPSAARDASESTLLRPTDSA